MHSLIVKEADLNALSLPAISRPPSTHRTFKNRHTGSSSFSKATLVFLGIDNNGEEGMEGGDDYAEEIIEFYDAQL